MNPAAVEPGPPASTFDVVPIAITRYHDHPDLPTAEEEARRVAEILAEWGGDLRPWDVTEADRSLDQALSRLRWWSNPPVSRSSVLLWFGHGSSNDDDAVVHLPTGETDIALVPQQFASYVIEEHAQREGPDWAVVVVEACGAIRFVEKMVADLSDHRVRDGVLLIGSGEDRGEGYLGDFRRALEEICASYRTNDKVISLWDLAGRFEDVLRPGFVRPFGLAGRTPLVRRPNLTPTVTAPVDVYPDLSGALAAVPVVELVRLARTGLGTDLLEIGGHFVGRVAERSAVVTWLTTHRSGLFVLTGGAGSGKSALLANLLLHAVPALRAALTDTGYLGDDWADGHSVPPVDGALLLVDATITEVVDRLARIAEVEVPAGPRPADRMDELMRELVSRPGPLTVFADALDEAREAVQIATLLGTLAGLPDVRIVLATRPQLGPAADRDDLLEAVRATGSDVTERTLHADRAADLTFAAARLRVAAAEVPDAELDTVLEELEGHLASGAGWDFLHVRLLVTELLATPGLLTAAHATERRATMQRGRTELFQRAVRRLAGLHPLAEPMLLALAAAQGRGLPRADRIWATAAGALASGRTITEADVDQVLRIAGPYIMLDAEDGRSVFRLAHRIFVEELRSRLDPGQRTAVLTALVELTRAASDPAPYLRRHLSGHAATLGAGGWAVPGDAPDVLDVLDLPALLTDSWLAAATDLPPAVLAVRRTAHLAFGGTAADRCGYRQLGAVQETGWSAAAELTSPGAAWRITGAHLERHPSHQTNSASPRVPVRALAACPVDAGTVVLAYGNDHGRLQLWNPWQGHTTALLPDDHRGGEILGLTPLGGVRGLLLASAGSEQPPRLWPLDPDREPTPLIDRDGGTACVVLMCPTDGPGPLLALGTTTGVLRLVGPDSARRMGSHRGRVTGLAVLSRNVVSVGVDGAVQRWDLSRPRRVRKGRWSEPLHSVAVVEPSGLMLTGDATGMITSWRAADLEPIGSFAAHDGPVQALAVLPGDAGPVVVASGGADGRVRLWDAATGTPTGPDLTGHNDEVTGLVGLRSPAGAPLVASCSRDGTVKVWTPASAVEPAAPGDDPPPVEIDSGRHCAVFPWGGRMLEASSERSELIAIRWADTGEPAHPPLRGHADWVRALLALPRGDGSTTLVSGGDDGRVILWDPVAGTRWHQVDLGGGIRGLAPGSGPRRFVVGLHDGRVEIEVAGDVLGEPAEGDRL